MPFVARPAGRTACPRCAARGALQAFAANLVSAAVRLVPSGTDGHVRRPACCVVAAVLLWPTRPGTIGCRRRLHATRNPVHEALPLMTTARTALHGPPGSARRPCRVRQDCTDGAPLPAFPHAHRDSSTTSTRRKMRAFDGDQGPDRTRRETGGCPHRIREDASINLAAIVDMQRSFRRSISSSSSRADNLAATFSPELADLTIYVMRGREDSAQGRARYALRHLRHQQDGPGAARRCVARGHGLGHGEIGDAPFVMTNSGRAKAWTK